MATDDETKNHRNHVTDETRHVQNPPLSESDDDVDDEQDWDEWNSEANNDEEEAEAEVEILCLFCDAKFVRSDDVFRHCSESHRFDFVELRKMLGLDFYGCVKLFNYIRSQVAEGKCWPFSNEYLGGTVGLGVGKYPWDDEKYLSPFIEDDALLYVFGEDEDDVDYPDEEDKEELVKVIEKLKGGDIVDKSLVKDLASEKGVKNGWTDMALTSHGYVKSNNGASRDQGLKGALASAVTDEIKNANRSYFGGYSSFVIHREMISDKVRTDAYREAILGNPSLFNGAVVMDIGCGTGILSLFAAQAGASRVVAVEASEKMASVATQIAKDNNLLCEKSLTQNKTSSGHVQVVHGMIEEIKEFADIQPNSVDVLMSEWMGYCLLYETMLNSVLLARDRWLKPGGAILPDTANMLVAGFGKGATSLPFWEDVYGFNMSCIGNEVVEHASKNPIVDVVDKEDIVTDSVVLKAFDLTTVTPEELDFTTSVELKPKSNDITWCHGLVIWFDTNFSNRFCKEKPTVLSTSPFTQKTHWSQTILTFREPVALSQGNAIPASKLKVRISIARAAQHRSIDISIEITTIDPNGKKHSLPPQLFTL